MYISLVNQDSLLEYIQFTAKIRFRRKFIRVYNQQLQIHFFFKLFTYIHVYYSVLNYLITMTRTGPL